MNDLISTKEAAGILGVSRKTLENWRTRKLFGVPFFAADELHGDTWYYYRERVEQLKSVYQRGALQRMELLAKNLENFPSPDFQKPPSTCCTLTTGFYSLSSVAKILGVDKSTLSRWRDKEIFVEDFQTHVGISLYSQDRVLQLKLFCQKNAARQANTEVFEQLLREGTDSGETLEKINVQIRPSKKRVELNDKQTRVLFRLGTEDTEELLDGATFEIIEKRNHKKYGDILTAYKLLNTVGYDIRRPLTQFDRAVLSVCISEWLAGNRYTTPAIIYRALTGKVGKGSDSKPTKAQRDAILDSIQLLICRTFLSDPSDARALLKYDDGNTSVIKSVILPAWYAENTTVNGKDTGTIIFFDRPCPLLYMAQAKKQILTYDTCLLNVPGQQNTTKNIEIKNYCMIRVQESKAHPKQMSPIVTFNDVFVKCGIEHISKKVKQRTRKFIRAFFDHIKNKGIIKDYEIIKNGNDFYSFKFFFEHLPQ